MAKALTLPSIFKEVSKTLSENEAVLNEADTYNHNHGTNMAAAFQTVSKAVAKKKDLPVSEQLAYASEVMRASKSGSAQIYAQGLANAAQRFQGKQLNDNTIGLLIDSMMGMQEPAQASSGAASSSLLGSLLGGLTGGAQPQQQSQPSGGDLLVLCLAVRRARAASAAVTAFGRRLLGSLLAPLRQRAASAAVSAFGWDCWVRSSAALGGAQPQQQSQPSGGDCLVHCLRPIKLRRHLDITDLLSAG
jgi:hypothetical protein